MVAGSPVEDEVRSDVEAVAAVCDGERDVVFVSTAPEKVVDLVEPSSLKTVSDFIWS